MTEPSILINPRAITTIDVGNTATNVIPETCRATVNIRFNDAHSGQSLTDWLQNHLDAVSEKQNPHPDECRFRVKVLLRRLVNCPILFPKRCKKSWA